MSFEVQSISQTQNQQEAIRICKEDKNWNRLKKPSQPSIEEIIAFIEKEIANLETD
jgi:hypothetical protein